MMEPLMLTMSLQDDSILLNSAILEALERPWQVQILINDEAKMLVLRACTMDDQQAVVVPGEKVMQFEISGRSLLKRIRKLTGWMDDRSRTIVGEYLPAHQAVRFNLMEAQTVSEDQVGDADV